MSLFGEKGRFIPAVVFSIALFASCSNSKGSQGTGDGSCMPASGSAGSEVACQTAALEEDCTLFFGTQPIDFERNASDDSVNFTVPSVPAGEVNITARCGEDAPVVIQDGFVVLALSLNPEKTAPEAIEKSADGDEIIAPSTPANVPPPSSPSDAPTASPPPPTDGPSGGGETSAAFTVKAVETAGARLSTYRIEWNVSNAKAVYLAGNVFGRSAWDVGLPKSDQCGVTGDGRYLVTNPDGSNLNAGSANYQKYEGYREGVLCDDSNAQTEDDCEIPSNDGGGILTPDCRIDLTNLGDAVYVRSLVHHGRVCLAVQGTDDAWEVTCKTVDAPEPELTVAPGDIAISNDKPVITLHLAYKNAMGKPMISSGCVETAGSSGPGNSGSGFFNAECPLNKKETKISVGIQGIGAGNVDSRKFLVSLGKPWVELKLFGSAPCVDCEGVFELQYKAWRTFLIRDAENDAVLEWSTCPWVKEVYFEGFPSGDGYHPVTTLSDVEGTKAAHQDGDHVQWWFGVKDFDGQHEFTTYKPDIFPNENAFLMTAISGSGGTHVAGDGCDDGTVTLYQSFNWSGTNLKSLTIAGLSGQNVTYVANQSTLPVGGPGIDEKGTIKIIRQMGEMNGEWDAGINFKVTATFHDGKTKVMNWNIGGWSCH